MRHHARMGWTEWALLLAAVSLVGLARPRLRALLICWVLVAALFTIAGSRIDMVDKQVFYLDIGEKFLTPEGALTAEIMPDALHPNFRGYRIWAEAIGAKVSELMR